MNTLLKLYLLLFPLGAAMLIAIQILKRCIAIDRFTVGFFEGMSITFIVAGLSVEIGRRWAKKQEKN